MKRIEVEIREECTYRFVTEVDDDFPDGFTGNHDRDEELRLQLIEAWVDEGNPIDDIYDVLERSVESWNIPASGAT
ncbi:hypothetical protein ACFV6Y_39290 [Streptomyces massasporeus]|uniref:hypothetical protein n=1 Tax=Streptomyces massasporeus TaxID=67324 RepID=UPI00365A3A4D